MKRFSIILMAALALLFSLQHSAARTSKSNIGTVIPELKLQFSGKAPEIKGKPYVLEFWATWCPPCRQSIPHLNELNKKYKALGLTFIGATSEDRQTVRNFLKDVPIDYTVAFDNDGKLNKSFGIEGIPHAMIVNKEGKIVWEGHPMSMPESELDAVVK
ncbi:MAG: hypothetical protein RL693_1948 [Verrucomicrobiota bacterium]|jgi:thiol-disulfide isomerase/thioredoxin